MSLKNILRAVHIFANFFRVIYSFKSIVYYWYNNILSKYYFIYLFIYLFIYC